VVLMNNFKAEPMELREAMLHAVGRVLESGWYVLGNEVVTFERLWASACGAAFGVGVGNGMDAIEIALRASNIGPGDEVITTPMTAFASVLAILRAGATPVLADINFDSALLSLESAERCISPRTKAVLLVHLYGQVRDMDAWVAFCSDRNIALLEDCAQAHLATWRGKIAGNFGAASAFSFYPTKNLGALGDAGMLVTNAEELAQRAARIRNYGQSTRYHHPEIGMNSRLDEVHAAMLTERLAWLGIFTARRREIAAAYRAHIVSPYVQLPSLPEEHSAHVYHLFAITSDRRDELQRYLLSRDIQTLIHYPIPVHMQGSCRDILRDPKGLPNSESYASETLSIPCHPQMSSDDIEMVITAVNSFSSS
jgi:dTDP-4-amino-4,6-dideoxygalactose transaminase